AVRVYISPEGEVKIVTQAYIISAVLQSYPFLGVHHILRRQDAGTLAMGDRENGKWNEQGSRHSFYFQVGGTGDHQLVGYHLDLPRTELEVGSIQVTGGVAVLKTENGIVRLPFRLLAMYKAFAVLGAGIIDLCLLRIKIIPEGIGIEALVPVLEL